MNYTISGAEVQAKRLFSEIHQLIISAPLACIVVSLLTPPIESDVSAAFYARVRPFGFWKREAEAARLMNLPMPSALRMPLVFLNILLGLIASFSLYMTPVYCLGHWPAQGAVCALLFASAAVILYFTWYRTLPKD